MSSDRLVCNLKVEKCLIFFMYECVILFALLVTLCSEPAHGAPKDVRKSNPIDVPKSEHVKLKIKESSGITRRHCPVRASVPFPEGELHSTETVRLLNPAGEEVPVQCEVLGRWPNNSIKWLLLNYATSLKQGSVKGHIVEYGAMIKSDRTPDSPVKVLRQDSAIIVSTGLIKAEINLQSGNLLDRVDLDKTQSKLEFPPDASSRSDDGFSIYVDTKSYGLLSSSAKAPDSVRVEESGPLRAIIRVSGMLGEARQQTSRGLSDIVSNAKIDDEALASDGGLDKMEQQARHDLELDDVGMRYEARLHFFAKRPEILCDVVFINTGSDAVRARRFGSQFPLPPSKTIAAFFGGFPQNHIVNEVDRCIALHQSSDARYVIKEKGEAFLKKDLSGIRAPGTVASEYSKCGLALCMGDFWQQYPVELAVSSGMMRAGYNGMSKGRIFRFDPGLSKRLRFVIRPYRSDKNGFGQARSITRRLKDFIRPLIAHPSADWFCKSEAFGAIPTADKEQYPCFERVVSLNGAKVMSQHERRGEYGMRDFGDWFDWESDRRGIWMNMEYDVPHSLFLQYVRSGDRKFFDMGVAAVRHYMDIDCIHPNSASDDGGGVHIHSKNHTDGGVNYGHIWAKGVLDYYFLTGDRRALRVARQMAEYCLDLNPSRLRAKERNIGWPLQVLMDVYNATLDQRYLAGARKLAHEACEWQNPHRGVWEHTVHPSRRQGGVPFMAGILADGLEKYYRVTNDSKTSDAILLGADWLRNETREKSGVYLYKQTLNHGAYPDLRLLNWLLRCYDITGEKRYAKEARELYREEMKRTLRGTVPKRYPPGTDNYFAIRMRSSLRFLKMFPEVDRRFTRSHEQLVTSLAKRLRFLRNGPFNHGDNSSYRDTLKSIRRANRCGDIYGAWDKTRNLVVGNDWNMQQTVVALARCGYGRLVRKLALEYWNDKPEFQRVLAGALHQGGCFQEAAHLRRKLNK